MSVQRLSTSVQARATHMCLRSLHLHVAKSSASHGVFLRTFFHFPDPWSWGADYFSLTSTEPIIWARFHECYFGGQACERMAELRVVQGFLPPWGMIMVIASRSPPLEMWSLNKGH